MLDLTPLDALLALALLGVPTALAYRNGLGITVNLWLSFGRALLQLIVLAYLLAFAFSFNHPGATAAVLVLLGAMSTQLLSNRIDLAGIWPWAGAALAVGGLGSVGYVLAVVLRPEPWFSPQLWISLGSTALVQGVSSGAIAANHLHIALQQNRSEVEMQLSLGASPAQATRRQRQAALRAGVLPNLGNLAIAGLGSIPLFMGGLLISGLDPLEAVLLELLLILVLICTSVTTSLILVHGVTQLSFTAAAQLRESK